MPKEICIEITISSKMIKGALAAGLLAALSLPLLPETITMTTEYPAPVGVYNRLTTVNQTLLARDGGSVGVGTAASPSAAFEIKSTTQGFLPPRMTSAQRDAVASPAAGLTIYNTTAKEIEFYNGSAWSVLGGGDVQMSRYANNSPQRTFFSLYNNGGKNRLVWIGSISESVSGFGGGTPDISLSVNGVEVTRCAQPVNPWPATLEVMVTDCVVAALVPPGGTYQAGGSLYSDWVELDF